MLQLARAFGWRHLGVLSVIEDVYSTQYSASVRDGAAHEGVVVAVAASFEQRSAESMRTALGIIGASGVGAIVAIVLDQHAVALLEEAEKLGLRDGRRAAMYSCIATC